ncbi:hypothetical protein jhhlp_008883 [Lomentospora prolificans]|uniref:glutathione transferase n=1 Tax=Lomentospora prolificans TaxID=41688 RepID=A0A2N3MZB6_9PEZI|nr:hypothetical protein jhhlp_008883 [Lomentospora prolificans]
MAIKLYGSRQSSCTQRVLVVLSELGLDYEISDINLQLGEHKCPEYIQDSHLFGLIPALEDDRVRLFESRAICKYLLANYGKDMN